MVWIMHVVNGKRSLINFVFAALQLAGLSITSLALPLSLVEPHSSLKWSQVNAERIKFVARRPLHPIVQVCALAFFIFFSVVSFVAEFASDFESTFFGAYLEWAPLWSDWTTVLTVDIRAHLARCCVSDVRHDFIDAKRATVSRHDT